MRRAWRIVTFAGVLGTIYVLLCIAGAPRIKFLTELHATPFDFGLIAGLGAFAIGFQIIGSIWCNRVTMRKPLWMTIAILHRLAFLGVAFAPYLRFSERGRIWWIIGVMLVHDGLAHVSSPLWLSWMADLLPTRSMNRHWAVRQRLLGVVNVAVMAAMAYGFNWFEKSGQVILGFIILAVIGVIVGVLDIVMFTWVPEPRQELPQNTGLLATTTQPIRDRSFRPFLYFMGFWNFSIFLSAPFFGLFMLEELGYSVLTVQLVGLPAAVGIVISSRFWGLLCDTYGFRPVLELLTIGKALTPLFFIFTPRNPEIGIPFLALMHFLDGVMNAGVALACQGVLLKNTPRQNRSMYIAASNFLSMGIAATVAPILAGALIDLMNRSPAPWLGPYPVTGYFVAFAVSALLRTGAIGLVRRLHEPGCIRGGELARRIAGLSALRATRWVYRLHESETETGRLHAARKLGQLRNPIATGELIDRLEDSSKCVREASAEALGLIGEAEAAKPLARALRDPDLGIQCPAARALGRIGGEQSLRALLQNLRPNDSSVLPEIVDSLGTIGDSAAIVPLICLFHDNDNEALRQRIAAALGRISEYEDPDEVISVLSGRA